MVSSWEQRASLVAFEMQADGLRECPLVGATVESDGHQVQQLEQASAVAQAVGALADEFGGDHNRDRGPYSTGAVESAARTRLGRYQPALAR